MMRTALWTAQEIADVFQVEVTEQWHCQGISIDSRTVEEGDLFFALIGPKSDGHDYVKLAIAKGAVAAVVSKPILGLDPKFLVIVDNAKDALDALGRAARARVNAPIIAITGSVGKTGMKEVLKNVLARNSKVHASVLSYNNDIGVPLSLARMPRDVNYGIFELGMNHAGELRNLSKMVRPNVAIITTVELAHSAHFKNIEEIADAKTEIFEGLMPGGTVILNQNNDQFDQLKHQAEILGITKIVSFGSSEAADAYVLRQVVHDTCSCIIAKIMGHVMTYKIGLLGHHWIINSLAILAAVDVVGGDLGLSGLELAQLRPLKGRGRRHQVFLEVSGEKSILLIDESYNANPASMRAAIETLVQTPLQKNARHIAILGDMAELGERSDELHEDLAKFIKDNAVDMVYTVGPHMKKLFKKLTGFQQGGHFSKKEALKATLSVMFRPGDVVMVKGSNARGMNKIVTAILAMGHDIGDDTGADRETLNIKRAL